jgi:phosphoribosylformimino-5-aminoimidazole carboxamide ribotide isomerase
MMGGVNINATRDLAEAVSVPVIASGGVTDIRDIAALLEVETKIDGGITGVITGRAIYEGTLDLAEAIKLANQPR